MAKCLFLGDNQEYIEDHQRRAGHGGSKQGK